MRHDLDEVERAQAAQHLPLDHDRPAVLEHPHLAAVLVLVRRRRLLVRVRLGLVHGAAAALHHPVREREVVAEARVDLEIVLAAHRVDRAVAAGDGVDARLVGAQRQLEAPVQALLVAAVAGLEVEPPADVRDVRVGEGADELPQRVGRPRAVRVGEGDDVALRLAHGAVLCGHLAAARIADHARAGGLGELLRPVGGGVGGDDDLEAVGRVVELAEIRHAALDHRLLVVGGDDHGDRRQRVLVGAAPAACARGPAPAQRAGTRRASTRARPPKPRRRPLRSPSPERQSTAAAAAYGILVTCRAGFASSSARGRTS